MHWLQGICSWFTSSWWENLLYVLFLLSMPTKVVVVCYLWVCLGALTRGKISSLGSLLGQKIRKEVLEKLAELWGHMTQISMAHMYYGFPYSFEVSPSSNTVTARELWEMYFKWAESCWKWLDRQKKLYPSLPASVKVFWELRWKQGTDHTSVTPHPWCSVLSWDTQCSTGEKSLNLMILDSSLPTGSTELKALTCSAAVSGAWGLMVAGVVFPMSCYFCHSKFQKSPKLSPQCEKRRSKSLRYRPH